MNALHIIASYERIRRRRRRPTPSTPPPSAARRALLRDDLGRVAAGAKADVVLWKARSWRMTPLRDPVKDIVYNASDEDVDRVCVNGRLVVEAGRVFGADERKILGALQAGGDRMLTITGSVERAKSRTARGTAPP